MVFNSIHFLLFFPIVTVVYFLLAQRYRWAWLLAASCYFYMVFKPSYILILLFTIIIDYYAGLYIEGSTGRRRKQWLVISLIANIGVLAVFKYYNFFLHYMPNYLFDIEMRTMGVPLLNILFPVGLSFHTFQAMSYTIEVYRGHQRAERHFGLYALYVMFYPQLVAGPIERPQNILHQFKEKFSFDYERVVSGLQLMAWGMFKKVVIADRLAIFVDAVYNHPHDHKGPSIVMATIFFTFQIFCDFSGYSDIAIGSARVMGFDLMKNFNRPYHATSIADFWRRWHISLSTWFRDYLYIPLGGSRVSRLLNYRNYFIVFFLSGLWHGANWNYMAWGTLHAFYLIVGLATRNVRQRWAAAIGLTNYPRLHQFLNVAITFVLVALAWMPFRMDYVSPLAMYAIIGHTTEGWAEFAQNWHSRAYLDERIFMFQEVKEFIYAIAFIILLEIIHYYQARYDLAAIFRRQKWFVRWGFYIFVVFIFIMFGVFESEAQFIYFQF